MLFNPPTINYDMHIYLNNIEIEQVESYKFLGFVLDNKLNFNSHTDHLVKKLNSCCFILNTCRSFLNISTLVIIFNAIGLSHINYCGLLLFNSSKLNITKITNKYNHCAATIFNCQLNQLNDILINSWKPLNHVLFINKSIFIHNILFHNYAPIFKYFFEFNKSSYNLRTQNIALNRKNKNIGQKAFDFWGPKFWNDLPNYIKNIHNLESFKKEINLIEIDI